jgi:hypothetical protein
MGVSFTISPQSAVPFSHADAHVLLRDTSGIDLSVAFFHQHISTEQGQVVQSTY